MVQVCPLSIVVEFVYLFENAHSALRAYNQARETAPIATLTADKAAEVAKQVYALDSYREALRGFISPTMLRTIENVTLSLVL